MSHTHRYHSSLELEMDDFQMQLPRSLHLCFIQVLFYIQPILSIFQFFSEPIGNMHLDGFRDTENRQKWDEVVDP